MVTAIGLSYLYLWGVWSITLLEAGYHCARAFILAELACLLYTSLSMSLSALQVPAQEREQVIAFVAEIDMLAQARKVVDAVLASLSVQFDLKG